VAAIKAKLITIIADSAARELITVALTSMDVRGYSLGHVEGMGKHGHRASGITDTKNLVFMIVVRELVADEIMAWFETELAPNYASIAYTSDVTAAPADRF
jgi:hypothetical protein